MTAGVAYALSGIFPFLLLPPVTKGKPHDAVIEQLMPVLFSRSCLKANHEYVGQASVRGQSCQVLYSVMSLLPVGTWSGPASETEQARWGQEGLGQSDQT